jgi:hypothetical protein
LIGLSHSKQQTSCWTIHFPCIHCFKRGVRCDHSNWLMLMDLNRLHVIPMQCRRNLNFRFSSSQSFFFSFYYFNSLKRMLAYITK